MSLLHHQRRRQTFSFERVLAAWFQTTTLLGLTAFAVGGLMLSLYLDQQHDRVIENARTNAANLARAFEQHTVRSIKSVDQALLFVRKQYEKDPNGFRVESWTNDDYYLSDLAVQMAMIGPDGIMVSSNLGSTSKVDLSDREHFRVHLNTPDDRLFISKPVLGRVSKRWTIQLTRKIRKPDGSFGGVLVASLDPYYLARLYDSIDIGQSGAITLVGTDGIIRARGGMNADVLGKSLSQSLLMDEWRKAPSGAYESESSIDGVPRIVSYRQVDGFPLIVAVALGRTEVLAEYLESHGTLVRTSTLVACLLLATMIWGIAERFRLDTTREDLLSKARALSSTLTNMQEGILMADADGQVVIINDHALGLLSLPNDAFTLPFPFSNLPLEAWDEERADGDTDAAQVYEHTTANGMILEVRTIPVPGGGFIKTLSDITQRRNDQRVLERARDKAEAASRARTAFLATMSHEIRTPLSGVLSMVDLLASTPLDDDQRRYLDITRDSAEHLLQLIDDILDVTKLDAEKLKLENIYFDLHRLVQGTLELVSPKALANGLSVGCLLGPDVPREIEGDPSRLRQILLNLVGNAIKFTSRGHVLLDVSCTRSENGDQHLLLRIEDTGIGIAEENLNDLFRDFSQLDSSISRRFGGTGLGLAICRKLSSRMGGRIWVESVLDRGTTFFVEIPLRSRRVPTEVVQEDSSVAIAAADPFERDLLHRQIAPGFRHTAAFATIEEAAGWLGSQRQNARAILLVDSSAAPAPGIAASLPAHPDRPIEAYLVCARQEITASEALQGGFAGFVPKPVFLESVRESIARNAAGETPAGPARTKSGAALSGMDILLAEDNPTNQFALRRILELMGAQVCVVGNGREALLRVQAEAFDLILMDMMMPEMDGLTATRQIRKLPEPLCSIPIVALTANAFVEDREAALASGMNGFATKPITGNRLLEAIRSCLSASASERRAQVQATTPAQGAEEFDAAILDELRDELGADYVQSAIGIFLADLNTRVDAMLSPDLSRNALGNHGHALKSSAATLGLTQLSALAANIEQAIRKGDPASLGEQIQSLLSAAQRASEILKNAA